MWLFIVQIGCHGWIHIHLYVVSASENDFNWLFTITLCNCSCLEWLDLSDNHLSGFVVLNAQSNKYSRKLQMLSLWSNYFNNSIPSLIWKLPALQMLDLSSNSFTGELLRELSRLIAYKIPLKSNLKARIWFVFVKRDVMISLKKVKNSLEFVFNALVLLDVSSN